MTEGAVPSVRFLETVEDLLGRGHAVRFQADGWSMHPTIRYGEIIVIQPLAQTHVRAGDILLYRRAGTAIAHRVVRMVSSTAGRPMLIVRGDAADCDDSPVELEQVLGHVVAVERRGRLLRFGRVSRTWSPIFARTLRRLRVARAKVAERMAL